MKVKTLLKQTLCVVSMEVKIDQLIVKMGPARESVCSKIFYNYSSFLLLSNDFSLRSCFVIALTFAIVCVFLASLLVDIHE